MTPPPTPEKGPDVRTLTRFLYELNIARRKRAAYPKGHPAIAEATAKAVAIFNALLESCETVTLGIARETLVLGDAVLERKNPVFKDLARHLFTLGVASLTFNRGLTRGELGTLNEVLTHSRGEIL